MPPCLPKMILHPTPPVFVELPVGGHCSTCALSRRPEGDDQEESVDCGVVFLERILCAQMKLAAINKHNEQSLRHNHDNKCPGLRYKACDIRLVIITAMLSNVNTHKCGLPIHVHLEI
jgi:hypothetical protein